MPQPYDPVSSFVSFPSPHRSLLVIRLFSLFKERRFAVADLNTKLGESMIYFPRCGLLYSTVRLLSSYQEAIGGGYIQLDNDAAIAGAQHVDGRGRFLNIDQPVTQDKGNARPDSAGDPSAGNAVIAGEKQHGLAGCAEASAGTILALAPARLVCRGIKSLDLRY